MVPALDAEVIPVDCLPAETWTHWETIRRSSTAYLSPFFSSRFVKVTAETATYGADDRCIARRFGSGAVALRSGTPPFDRAAGQEFQ